MVIFIQNNAGIDITKVYHDVELKTESFMFFINS